MALIINHELLPHAIRNALPLGLAKQTQRVDVIRDKHMGAYRVMIYMDGGSCLAFYTDLESFNIALKHVFSPEFRTWLTLLIGKDWKNSPPQEYVYSGYA